MCRGWGRRLTRKDGDGPPEYGISKSASYFLGYEFGKGFGNSDGVLHNMSFPLEAALKVGLGTFGTLSAVKSIVVD